MRRGIRFSLHAVASAGLAAIIAAGAASAAAHAAGTEKAPAKFKKSAGAEALYEGMLTAIRDAQTLSCESAWTWTVGGQEYSRSRYSIWLKKPNCARIEAKAEAGGGSGVLVGDGSHFWIYWPSGRPWTQGLDPAQLEMTRMTSYMKKWSPPGMHSLAHEFNMLGAGIPMSIFEWSEFHGCRSAMEPYRDGVSSSGVETVGGEECDVVEASFMDRQRSCIYWISRRDHLPRRMKQFIRLETEQVDVEELSDIRVNEEIPDTLFSWKPPEGWVEYRLPALEDGLLKVGSEAPDFEIPLMDGSTFRLSGARGSVVWLTFWRIGCQPCRQEMPELQKLHKKWGERGLTVIGFNCADELKLVVDFLEKYGIRFANIVDTSESAQAIYFTSYQKLSGMAAVPLTYIIDREGKVAEAFYGYEAGAGEETLKRLGIVR